MAKRAVEIHLTGGITSQKIDGAAIRPQKAAYNAAFLLWQRANSLTQRAPKQLQISS